jgi:hypothetical protein
MTSQHLDEFQHAQKNENDFKEEAALVPTAEQSAAHTWPRLKRLWNLIKYYEKNGELSPQKKIIFIVPTSPFSLVSSSMPFTVSTWPETTWIVNLTAVCFNGSNIL